MSNKGRQDVQQILETAVATQDPKVIAEARKALEEIVKREAQSARKPVELPTASQYSFKQGEQVALSSDANGIRTHYEYLERSGKFDKVLNTKTGKTHRVWLDKVIPMAVATRMIKEQEKRREQAEREAMKAKKNA